MNLTDEVSFLRDSSPADILDTVPAYVFNRSAGIDWGEGNVPALILVTEMRIMIEPHELATPGRHYLWNSQVLVVEGEAEIAMVNGNEHHYTLTARRVG